MFKYTKSTINETFDFIKRLIYIFQVGIQFVYILYIIYRLVDKSGNLIGNIILLVVSTSYLLFQLITTREFYTKKQIIKRRIVRRFFKSSKYLVNIYIITLSVMLLINGNAHNDNATMLITILMIMGVLFSMLFDLLLALIDRQIELIKSALSYDVEMFRVQHGLITKTIKKLGFDLEKEVPSVENQKIIDRVKKVKDKQDQKKARKILFHKKHSEKKAE